MVDTSWVAQEVIWGAVAIQNVSTVVGPTVLKLYLDYTSHKIEWMIKYNINMHLFYENLLWIL